MLPVSFPAVFCDIIIIVWSFELVKFVLQMWQFAVFSQVISSSPCDILVFLVRISILLMCAPRSVHILHSKYCLGAYCLAHSCCELIGRVKFFYYFILFFWETVHTRAGGAEGEWGDSQAGSTLRTEPDMGLRLLTVRAWPEPKPELDA